MTPSTQAFIMMIVYLLFFLAPFIVGIGLTIHFLIKYGTRKRKDR